tara:strand:+ start:11953 stop:13311 length:1359 start_codon:yes stop_codon:yes gene_type:complete
MNISNINTILNRTIISDKIKSFLDDFQENKTNLLKKRGLYIYGAPGNGKTTFVRNLLKEHGYDYLLYDAGDIRNKTVIETITKHHMTDSNIMSTFYGKKQHIAIIMDEIDGMNNGDKGGINTLIKLIRPKKTKKQKKEDTTNSPIICISNYHADKKIKELMKVCEVFELKSITQKQMNSLVKESMPRLKSDCSKYINAHIQGDLRKLSLINNIYDKNKENVTVDTLKILLHPKSYNDDTKRITYNLFNKSLSIDKHNTIMNETDRTIVGLLWHENIIDILEKGKKKDMILLYLKFLENICFADFIDRVTFQKQIWQFNELSSLIKTFFNSHLLHCNIKDESMMNNVSCENIRFTKVLTKYSTEYNNSVFIQKICQQLGMDKKDMFIFFKTIRETDSENKYAILYENHDVSKLDINRISRYLDKHVSESTGASCGDMADFAGVDDSDNGVIEE